MSRTIRLVVLASMVATLVGVVFPEEASAQRRAVRRPAGRHVVVVAPRHYYRPYFYHPYYYGPYFYGGFHHAWWGWQYPHPPYGYGYYDSRGSARIQVTPKNAQVFVDGYFVGIVDDFDGYLQRLHVEAGEHELTLYLEGYRTIRERVLFRPGATLKISYEMQPLGQGEQNDPRPVPDESARGRREPARVPAGRSEREPQAEYGTLSLRVQPDDAVVIIDGDEWDRAEGEDRFYIDLPEGTHRLEVRKEGFKPYSRTIQVRRGQTFTLNVSLTPGGGAVPE